MLLYTGSKTKIPNIYSNGKKAIFGGFCMIDVLKKIDFVTSFHKKPFHFTFRNLIYILSSQTLWRLNGEYPSDYVFNLYHRKNSINKI